MLWVTPVSSNCHMDLCLQRNPSTLPIGEFLYKMRSTLDSKKESLAERDRKLQKEQANCHYVGPTSQKLLGRIRQRGFKDIFDALDEDKVCMKCV